MANADNLKNGKSTQFRSGEEAARNGQNGGKSSGKSRRQKKAMRQAAAALLNMNLSGATGDMAEKIKRRMQAYGFDADKVTLQDAMLLGVMIKALNGDVRASEFLRDTAGDNPALAIRQEELKLKKEDLALKRDALMGGEKNDRDENNLLDAIRTVGEVDTSDLPEVE